MVMKGHLVNPSLESSSLGRVDKIMDLVSMLKNFFSSLLMTRPNKLECLYLAITFQSNLMFAGESRS